MNVHAGRCKGIMAKLTCSRCNCLLMKLESGGHDVVCHGAALICSESHEYLQPADITAPLVVVVHGLTSSGEYLGALERYIHRHESHESKKYLCATFNYDSYLEIDFAGRVLADLLGDFKNQIRQYGLVLVAHSMGGLVIRYAISLLAANYIKVLRSNPTWDAKQRFLWKALFCRSAA